MDGAAAPPASLWEEQVFPLQGNLLVKVTTNFRDDFERVTKRSKLSRLGNQVKVTFTVNGFNVCQTVEFLRKWAKCFRQVSDVSSLDREFSHICTHHFTFDTKGSHQGLLFEDFVVFFTDSILTNVNLDLTFAVLKVGKTYFTFTPFGYQASCDSSCFLFIM